MSDDCIKIKKSVNPVGNGVARITLLNILLEFDSLSVREIKEKLTDRGFPLGRQAITTMLGEIQIKSLYGYQLTNNMRRTATGTSKCATYRLIKIKK